MTSGVVDLRAAGIAHHTRVLRERSRDAVAAAAREFEAAEAALKEHRRLEQAIRDRRDEARMALTRAMDGRNRVLIGSSLITCNGHGGVHIEHVDLLGDIS